MKKTESKERQKLKYRCTTVKKMKQFSQLEEKERNILNIVLKVSKKVNISIEDTLLIQNRIKKKMFINKVI